MELRCNVDAKWHSTQCTYITFPRYYLVFLIFAAVFIPLWSHLSFPRCSIFCGPKVGACSKYEVLPQPDGSILSGGTVGPLKQIPFKKAQNV